MAQWTQAENELLLRLAADGRDVQECGHALGRTSKAVQAQANRIGARIRRKRFYKMWSPERMDALRSMIAAGKTSAECALVFGGTQKAVVAHAIRNGLHFSDPRAYRPEELERMRELRGAGLSNKQIAENLGRPINSIKWKMQTVFGGKPRMPPWSERENEIVRLGFAEGYGSRVIASDLKRAGFTRSFRAVDRVLQRLGLVAPVKRVPARDRVISHKRGDYSFVCALNKAFLAGLETGGNVYVIENGKMTVIPAMKAAA